MSPESVSRTFIGSVVCVDLVGYSTKPVAQQIQVKEAFNRLLAGSLKRVPEEDRIILDTGDGAAISFLGDPEMTLSVGLAIRDATHAHAAELGAGSAPGEGAVRIGINLGSVKLALDMNGYPRIVGDGINVAERIAAFAKPGEVVVSHSFYDMVSRLSDANAKLFRSEGKRTDKNGREHQIYAVRLPGEADAEPAQAAGSATMPPSSHATSGAPAGRSALVTFLEDRFKVGFAAALLVALIAAEAMLLVRPPSQNIPSVAVAPSVAPVEATARSAAPPEPVKVLPVKPEPVKAEPSKPEPVKAEPVKAEAKAEPPKPEPPKAAPVKAEAKPEPAKPEPAKPTTAKAEPKSARRVEEAKPAPAPPQPEWKPPEPPREPPKEEPKAVAAATTAVTPVSRSSVNFPPSAAAKNIDSGVVKARVTINAEGKVTAVQILEARPRRYFDEEATRSLREWRFNAGADNRTYDVEIAFQR